MGSGDQLIEHILEQLFDKSIIPYGVTVNIAVFHTAAPGSIPGGGVPFCQSPFFFCPLRCWMRLCQRV